MKFVSFCPLGEECGRKHRRLGSHLTLEKAKEKVIHHLRWSTNHTKMNQEEAAALAENVDYEEEEVEFVDEATAAEAEPTDDGAPADDVDASADKDQKWNNWQKADWQKKTAGRLSGSRATKAKAAKAEEEAPTIGLRPRPTCSWRMWVAARIHQTSWSAWLH